MLKMIDPESVKNDTKKGNLVQTAMGERVEGGDDEDSKCPTGKCQQQEEGGQQKDDPMMDGTADAYDLEKPSKACDESMAKCQSRVGKFFEKKVNEKLKISVFQSEGERALRYGSTVVIVIVLFIS